MTSTRDQLHQQYITASKGLTSSNVFLNFVSLFRRIFRQPAFDVTPHSSSVKREEVLRVPWRQEAFLGISRRSQAVLGIPRRKEAIQRIPGRQETVHRRAGRRKETIHRRDRQRKQAIRRRDRQRKQAIRRRDGWQAIVLRFCQEILGVSRR